MKQALSLRPMTPESLSRAAKLHTHCFPDQPWDAKALDDLLDSPGVAGFLAVSPGGTPEGMILLRSVADEAEVLTICVAPESRRAGLGRDLLRAGLSLLGAGQIARVFLEVAEDNLPAQGLYQSEGFVEVAERRDYYRRGESHVSARVLEKKLP